MPTIGEILVNFKADIANFTAQVADAKTNVIQMSEAATAAQASVSGLSSVMTTAESAVAGYLSVWAGKEIADFIETEAEAGAKILETANTVGVGARSYQEYGYAAAQVGVAHEALDKGLEFFTKQIGLASIGVGQSKKGFDELGIGVRDSVGNIKSTDVLFDEVVARLEGVSSASQRAAIESQLFGKNFASIAGLLNMGSAALEEYKKRADDIAVLNDDQLSSLAGITKEFRDLSTVVRVDLRAAVAWIGPTINPLIEELTEFGIAAGRSLRMAEPADELAGSMDKLKERLKDLNATIVADSDGLKNYYASAIASMEGPGKTMANDLEAKLAAAKAEKAQVLELMKQDQGVPAMSIVEDKAAPLPDTSGLKKQQEEAANYQRSLAEMVSASNLATDSQKSLVAAYQQGAKAVDDARVASAGAAASLKLDNEALKENQTASMNDRMEVGLQAQWRERATLATEHQKAATEAMAAASKSEYDSLIKLAAPTGDLTKKQQELADSVGKVWEAYDLGIIKMPEAEAQIKQLQTAVDAASKSNKEIVSAVERGASGFLDTFVKIGQTKDPILALGNSVLSLAQDIEKAILQAIILQPLMQSLGIDNGKLGSSGPLPELLASGGSWFKGLFGGGSGLPSNVSGNPLMNGPGYATGGSFDVGGAGGTDSQNVGFKATPGEHVAITPPGNQNNNGDVNVQIINNHSGAQVSAQASPDGRGGKSLIVQIDEAMAYGVATGRSQTATALQQTGMAGPRTPVSR